MCGATNNNSFDLVLTAVNEELKCIVYILDNIYNFLSRLTYNILYQMLSFWFPPGFDEMFLFFETLFIPCRGWANNPKVNLK